MRFSGFFTILSFDANPGFETADLAVGPTNYTLTDTIFGTSGYDPPSNPAGSTATIERNVGPSASLTEPRGGAIGTAAQSSPIFLTTGRTAHGATGTITMGISRPRSTIPVRGSRQAPLRGY